jgi:hypothetical protein
VTRRIAFAVAMSVLGFVVGGVVGLAAAVVSVANASRPRALLQWIILPVFVAMVVATLVEGRLAQDIAFAQERPIAHLLGLALAIGLFVLAVTARWVDHAVPEREP